MSDKTYTPPSGLSYEIKREPGGTLSVQKSGEKEAGPVRLSVKMAAIDSQTSRIHVDREKGRGIFWVYSRGGKRVISWPGGSLELDATDLSEGASAGGGSLKPLKLTMPGKVLSVKVKAGEVVEPGQGLVIVEAMKMENLLLATARARVAKVQVKEGDRLESGAVLITFEEAK
jgi:acetyl/propionyl-CoA carboxylase alpha subunit